MNGVFVWTISDVLGLIVVGALFVMWCWVKITDKLKEGRRG